MRDTKAMKCEIRSTSSYKCIALPLFSTGLLASCKLCADSKTFRTILSQFPKHLAMQSKYSTWSQTSASLPSLKAFLLALLWICSWT